MDDAVYYSVWGPANGPVRFDPENPVTLAVLADPGGPFVGTAGLAGYVRQGSELVAAYWLRVGETDLPGFYACINRRFVPLEGIETRQLPPKARPTA